MTIAGPENKYNSHTSGRDHSHQQQKKKAIGWLYNATEKYTENRLKSKAENMKNIQYCLDKIMSTSDLAFEIIVTYPFQKISSRKHSPFMHAGILQKTNLVEYYLSLYIIVRMGTLISINNHTFSKQNSFRKWLSLTGMKSTSHFLKEFDGTFSNDGNMTHIMSGKYRSVSQIIEYVESFLIDHPKRASRFNQIMRNRIARVIRLIGIPLVKQPERKVKKAKKRLPSINCQDCLELDVEDADVYSDYYDSEEEEYYDDNQESTYETGSEVGDSNQVTTQEEEYISNEQSIDKDNEDALSFQWDDMYELESLSDEELSEDVLSFNASFAADFDDMTRNDIKDDWDAIPEVQSVISVDTFSGEKQIFSYKDALFVNKEEPRSSVTVSTNEVVETKKKVGFELKSSGESDESDLYDVYFDHHSAKLKGGQD